MSNQIQIRALVEALKTSIFTAWGLPIDVGIPRQQRTGEYSVIRWRAVSVSAGGLGSMTRPAQSYTFDLYGRWKLPTDPTQQIDLLKADRANELIAQLQTASNYVGLAILPLVSTVDPDTEDDPQEAFYSVLCTFTCTVLADHH